MRRVLMFVMPLLALAGGSGKNTIAPIPTTTPRPIADSPVNAVGLLRWAWENRDPTPLRGLLTSDFVFKFTASDSAALPESTWRLDSENFATRRVFLGDSKFAAATSVSIGFDPSLVSVPDPRPGRDPRWHRKIETQVALSVRFPNRSTEVHGKAIFYLTRGDSATIPVELIASGTQPDSTRWWIDRWEDQTDSPRPGFHPLPTRPYTWGVLKWSAREGIELTTLVR